MISRCGPSFGECAWRRLQNEEDREITNLGCQASPVLAGTLPVLASGCLYQYALCVLWHTSGKQTNTAGNAFDDLSWTDQYHLRGGMVPGPHADRLWRKR